MKEVDLRMLAERGVGFNASVLTVPCGYVLQLETSKGLEVLRLQRGGERVFKTLDAVAALLGSVGITSFSVELQSSVSIPPLIEVPAILDPLCSNPVTIIMGFTSTCCAGDREVCYSPGQ